MGSTNSGKHAYSMRWIVTAILLLSFPFVFGISCNEVAHKDFCKEIAESDASDLEKEELISNLAYHDEFANHSYIYNRNANMVFTTAPQGVITKDNGNIRKTWLKIISIMPSVIYGNKLLSPGIGKVQTAYGYETTMPTGTANGDCKTEYHLKNNKADLGIFLNGNKIGTGNIVDFSGSGNLNFNAQLMLTYEVEAKHYKTFRWCCKTGSRGCRKYCEECRYSTTELIKSEVNIQDSKQAVYYRPMIFPSVKAVDRYSNTSVGVLNISNFDSFELKIGESILSQNNFFYDINATLAPYFIYTLRANNQSKSYSSNLEFKKANNSYKFYVPTQKGCELKFNDHFNSWGQQCNIDKTFSQIKIETKDIHYSNGELINVTLEPKNTLMKVSYGTQVKLAQNFVQFTADENANKISVDIGERHSERIIHVKDERTWDFAMNLGVFFILLYSVNLIVGKLTIRK